jgi:DUF1680 family protein
MPSHIARASLALAAIATVAASLASPRASAAAETTARRATLAPVSPAVRPFELEEVRLLDGPFKAAMERDGAYLLRLEPDRLLAWFRKEAGLVPKGEVYGGWESRGVAGHSLGHYLSALAMIYASTGDERYRDRVVYIVDELDECQRKNGNGYVAAIPGGKKIFAEVAAGDIRSQGFDLNGGWVPWYTLHKELAGLLDAHRYCESPKALAVATKLADWADATTAKLTDADWQKMLACEHGGMNESLAELAARTKNEKYLRLSRRFDHRVVLDPLRRGEDRLEGLHANTQIPKLIGLARLYELTNDPSDRDAAAFFWDRVVNHHSYAIGGNSLAEHFGPPDKLANRLGENTAETCNTYNMLKLTRHLFGWRPSVALGDYYERALYNHILASQNPDDAMMCYFIPLRPGAQKSYSTPFESFWCCVGSGIENHAKYGDSIYFHDDRSLYVDLFVPSTLRWTERGLTVTQRTDYPLGPTTTLTIDAERPTAMALKIRYPAWAGEGLRVAVNGEPRTIAAKPGSFAEISRTWKAGDRVEVTIPFALRTEAMPDDPKRVAILYGPLVLAGDLGAADAKSDAVGRMPVLVTEQKPISEWLRPVAGKPATFRTASVGRPGDVTLVPFYLVPRDRYSVYWDLFTKEEWAKREAEYRAEEARLRHLEEITIDYAQPGEMQPERDHEMRGEKTESGDGPGKKWRHALPGGWFSFDMKVATGEPTALVLTFWGSDAGNRTFDVLVDGTKVGTMTLDAKHPGEFFDTSYLLPAEATKGKERVTVRFQPHPGNIAGGVFGLRTTRVE